MILVDTSVWVDHLRRGDAILTTCLLSGEVVGHPFVTGEIACGTLRRRDEILGLLASLPQASVATHEEAMRLLEERRLAGRGLGWIDVHLLASALLAGNPLWTRDRRLADAAGALGVAANPRET